MTEASTSSFRTAKPRFHLYTIQEILRLPPFDWLIHGILESDCVGVIYGPSGGGKTFTALDWALSVASGQNWQGRKVNAGPVVYVVAEGQKNVRTRIKAWMKVHGVESVDDAALVLEAPQLLRRDDVEALLGQIQAWNKFPQLIVLDTFSQCFGSARVGRGSSRTEEPLSRQ